MLYLIIGDAAAIVKVNSDVHAAYPDRGSARRCRWLAKSISSSISRSAQHGNASVSSSNVAALAASTANSVEGGATSSSSWP